MRAEREHQTGKMPRSSKALTVGVVSAIDSSPKKVPKSPKSSKKSSVCCALLHPFFKHMFLFFFILSLFPCISPLLCMCMCFLWMCVWVRCLLILQCFMQHTFLLTILLSTFKRIKVWQHQHTDEGVHARSRKVGADKEERQLRQRVQRRGRAARQGAAEADGQGRPRRGGNPERQGGERVHQAANQQAQRGERRPEREEAVADVAVQEAARRRVHADGRGGVRRVREGRRVDVAPLNRKRTVTRGIAAAATKTQKEANEAPPTNLILLSLFP